MAATTRRGPYAKGLLRRQHILDEALAAYAESDGTAPSLRAIAARAGLSERGLLHYFASRDALQVAILEARDAQARLVVDPDGPVEQIGVVQATSAATPGLVRLFVEIAAAAPDPQHAGHAYATQRYARLRQMIARMFRRPPTQPAAHGDAEFAARMLIAASDGLQLQWMLDPTIDLEGDLVRLASLLHPGSDAASEDAPTP